MTAAWWVGAPPAATTIDCGPNRHRLVWEDGRLTAVDHADPGAERVLADLGGSEPACLSQLRHWAEHTTDPRVLTLAGRHPGDTLGLTSEDVTAVRGLLEQDDARLGTLGRHAPPTASAERSARIEANHRHLDLLELLSLDPALVRRLQAEVAHHLSAPDPIPVADRQVLEAATVGRLGPIVERWRTIDRPPGDRGAEGRVSVLLGDRPLVHAGPGGTTVTVRPDWLAAVWGRYLGVVDGFLVVEVHRIVGGRAEVTGWGAAGGAPALLTLAGPAPWHVVRRDDRES